MGKILEITLVAIGAAAVGVIALFVYAKRKAPLLTNLNEEVLDTTLTFEDVINFFKSSNLDQEKDIPFVAKGDCNEFRRMLHAPYPKKKEGYCTIFIGVYNETDDQIKSHKLIHAKAIDKALADCLGSENLVVLS